MKINVYQRANLSGSRPLAGFLIHAAFESPGTDYEEERISLDEYVTDHPEAVYYIKVIGDCMDGSGIKEDDLLVVDRSLKARNGDIILGVVAGQHILACYIKFEGEEYLMPDNPKYPPHKIQELDEFILEGVIPYTLLNQRKQNHVRIDRLQQFLRVMRKGIST